jgi:hypothetical protein
MPCNLRNAACIAAYEQRQDWMEFDIVTELEKVFCGIIKMRNYELTVAHQVMSLFS